MIPLRIIFAGSGEFGLPTLRAIREEGHSVVQVISQSDRPAGRGRALMPTPIANYALECTLPLLRTHDINLESLPAADLMIVIAFGQKIGEPIVHHARLGSINLHASRLPKYRGAAPINWAIINGESTTGNSVIRLAPKMDAGAILAQSEVHIGELETAGELHDRLAEDGKQLVMNVMASLAAEGAIESPQDESRATLAPKLKRESSLIDWSRPAREIANQIRGMFPWPGCRVRVIDQSGKETGRATLVRAKSVEGAPGIAGTILPTFEICAGQTAIMIEEIQPEGKRPMKLSDYRNGHPWTAGMRLESIR